MIARPAVLPTHPGRRTAALAAASWLLLSCGASHDDRISAVVDDPDVASPINSLLGIDADSTAMVDSERRAQESIGRCMADAGFRYVPVYVGADGQIGAAPVSELDDRTREYVEQHGYGVADGLRVQIFVSTGSQEDPNETFRAGLSTEEQLAYDAAMSGISPSEIEWDSEQGTPIDAVTGDTVDYETFAAASADGCLSKAYSESDPSAGALEILTSQAYQDLQNRINADDEMIALFDGWRACMASRGYEYQGTEQIIDELGSRATEIAHQAEAGGQDVDVEGLTEQVNVLLADEIGLALIDWECSAELQVEAQRIVRGHEVDFVREHEDLIVEVLDEQSAT